MLIIATGEHDERENNDGVKRLTVVAMWVVGVVLVAQFTATVAGSLAAEYLAARNLPYFTISSAQEGYDRLLDGSVQAIVFDSPTVQYWAARLGGGDLQVVGLVFRPVKYGIAVARGNPLRKRINEVLLELYSDGTYEEISRKWFSQAK